jgi:pyruvate kinase
MISLSFVRRPEDVDALVAELEGQGREDVGIVLKIENRAAFGQLGAILLTALRHPPVAVMIARGDLGVEVGFERMAEVQEEMLWLCEAAHVPVIWATQVLETLAQRGMATRAEVTDAAMSGRAECVMLNKGPHIVATVRTLSDILTRMEDHQEKKSALMRPLRVAGSSPETTGS